MPAPEQRQFDFSLEPQKDGYKSWQEQRREALRRLARQMGLPLGRQVEVWLRGEIRLCGVLRLREEMLFVEEHPEPDLVFMVDNVPFNVGEMESCVAIG